MRRYRSSLPRFLYPLYIIYGYRHFTSRRATAYRDRKARNDFANDLAARIERHRAASNRARYAVPKCRRGGGDKVAAIAATGGPCTERRRLWLDHTESAGTGIRRARWKPLIERFLPRDPRITSWSPWSSFFGRNGRKATKAGKGSTRPRGPVETRVRLGLG